MALKMKLGRLTGPLNSCQWCDFSTRSWTLFEQHLNRCQQRSEPANAKAATTEAKKMDFLKRKRNYRCDSCDFHASRPKPLLLHVKEAHQPSLEIFSCELCNYASRFKTKVSQHKRACHSMQAPDDASDYATHDDIQRNSTVKDVHEGPEKTASTKAEMVNAKSSGKKRKHPDSKLRVEEYKKSVKRPKLGKEVSANNAGSAASTSAVLLADSATHSSKISMPLLNANKSSVVKGLKPKPCMKEGAKGKGDVLPNVSVDSLKLIIKDVSVKSGNEATNARIVRYKCQLCSFVHSRRESIVKHLRSIHGKKVGHTCPKCDFVAKSKAKLTSHIQSHSKRKYRCPECRFKTLTKHSFLEHRACHVISGLYACHLCSFSSNTESCVISHKTAHHDKSDLPVSSALNGDKNSESDSSPPLLVKYTDEQSGVTQTSSEIQCDFCDLMFPDQSEVSQHMLVVHPGNAIYKCSICSIVYKCRRYLTVHLKQKHGIFVADRRRWRSKNEADESVSVLDATADTFSGSLPKLEKVPTADDSEVITKEDRKTNRAKSEKVRKLSLSKSKHFKCTDLRQKKVSAKGSLSENWNTLKKHETDNNSKKDSSGAIVADDKNSAGVGVPGKMQNLPEIVVQHEGNRTIFHCVKCDLQHTNKVRLESHLSRSHPGSILYQCPLCKYGALWRLSMKNHLKNHRKETKTLDELRSLLEQSFRLAAVATSSPSSQKNISIQDPLRTVPVENGLDVPSQDGIIFKIPKSKSILKGKKELKSKTPYIKEEPSVQIKTEVIDDAEIKFVEMQASVNKVKPGRWYCTECNTDCKNSVKLARHKERHANLKRFMCSACGVRSNYDFYIRNHIQKNHRPNSATMQVLARDEAKRTIAKYQKRTKLSIGQKPKADNCGKSSTNTDNSEELKNLVTKSESQIPCYDIKVEPEDKKPEFVVQTTNNRRKYFRWLCDQCTYASDSPAKLASHKEVHENLKRFLCPVCGVRSNWILYIQSHIRKVHRSAKVGVVELSREDARRTLPDFLKQCKGSPRQKAKKSPVKLKSSKKKNSTRSQDSERSRTGEPESSSVGHACSENLPRRNSKQLVFDQTLGDSLEMSGDLNVGTNLNETKSQESNALSATTNPIITKVCKYKKYKCSVCGMRSNWTAALRKHRLALHPHAKTIVMSISDAKASLSVYENELKPAIAASNLKSGTGFKTNLQKPKALKRLKTSKGHRLKKLKIKSGLVMFGCSQCNYKSKWRSNASKHVAGVHPTAEILKTDNRYIETSDEVQPNEKNSKLYSCSECGLNSELLMTMKKHIRNVHSSASILRLCLSKSKSSIFPSPHGSASSLRTSESTHESPTASVMAKDWNSPEKSITDCTEPCSRSPIAPTSKTIRPLNFACSGCSHRADRRLYLLRHIRSAHPKGNCRVIHIRPENRVLSKQWQSDAQIGSVDWQRETVVEKAASINADCGREWPDSVQDGTDVIGMSRYSNILDCDICPYRAPRHNQLLRHKKLHEERPGYTFECTFCPYYCPSAYCLQKHLHLHTTSGISGSSFGPLKDHAYSQTPPTANGKGEYSCDKCPFMSENCQRFVYHKQFHRPRPSAAYRCDVCPFWVPESKMMVQHAKLHERFSSQLAQQNEETGILDDVVETARNKWDIVAAKCFPAAGVQSTPGSVSGEARPNDNFEGKCPRKRALSPRSQSAQKSFTEMWLNGSLPGSENASLHEENSSDTLETSSLASKNTADETSKNGQSKDDESDFGRADHSSSNNVSSEFELPATRSWHCEKCPYLTVTLVHYKRHMSLHGSQQRYECQFCDYSVPRYFLLLQHKKLHLAPNRNLLFSQPVSSLLCIPQPDNGSEEYLKEITFVPSENEPTFFEDTTDFRLPSKLFRCEECPYSTIRYKLLVTHQKHHKVRAPFACPFCSYSVNDQRRLNSHVMEHFNLPGSEMSAYSASEAPDLMEAMKAEIIRISGRSMAAPISAKIVDDQPRISEITEEGEHDKKSEVTTVASEEVLLQRIMIEDSNTLDPGRKMLDDSNTLVPGKNMMDVKNALVSNSGIIDADNASVTAEKVIDVDNELISGNKIAHSQFVCDNEEDLELMLPKEIQPGGQQCKASSAAVERNLGSKAMVEELQPELDFEIVQNADYDEDRETSDADSVYQAVICKSGHKIRSDEEQQSELTDGENVTLIDDKEKLVLSRSVHDEDINCFPDRVQYEQINPVVCIIDSPIPDNEYASHQEVLETFSIFKVETTSVEQMNDSGAQVETVRDLPEAGANDEEDDILFISESESEMESNNCLEKDICTDQNSHVEQIAEQSIHVKLDACEERDDCADEDWHVTVNDEEDLYIELSPEPEEIGEENLVCANVDHQMSEEKGFEQSQLTVSIDGSAC